MNEKSRERRTSPPAVIFEHLTLKKLKDYCRGKFHLFYFYGHGVYWPDHMVADGQLITVGDKGDGTWAGDLGLEAEPDEHGHVDKHWFGADDRGCVYAWC